MLKRVIAFITILFTWLFAFPQKQTSLKKADTTFRTRTTSTCKYTASVIFQKSYYDVNAALICADSLPDIFNSVEHIKKELGNVLVTYDYIRINKNGKETNIDVTPYNNANINESKSRKEFSYLKSIKFMSGTIYFSGSGFPNIVSVKATDVNKLNSLYNICATGTTITFDNCIPKNIDGSVLKPITQTLQLK